MRWRGERESSNVEDRRGAGGGRGLPIGRGGGGIAAVQQAHGPLEFPFQGNAVCR